MHCILIRNPLYLSGRRLVWRIHFCRRVRNMKLVVLEKESLGTDLDITYFNEFGEVDY